MSASYERKLEKFIEGRTFTRLSHPVRNRADAHCDACGSLEPRILFGLKEKDSNRYFFVGTECLKWICQQGNVERRFSKDHGSSVFDREMERRRNGEGGNHQSAESLPHIQRFDVFAGNDEKASIKPQIHLLETPESYVALVQISHNGRWSFGLAETQRFEAAWEGHGNGEVVLQQVKRERNGAALECVKAATEDALNKLTESTEEKKDVVVSSDNGHCDWTHFWRTIIHLGLERDELVELIDVLMPREWLTKHPGRRLDDLLNIIRERHETKSVDPVVP